MRRSFLLAAMIVTCAASAGYSQTGDVLTPIETAVACAPPPTADAVPEHALQIIGSQDPLPRALFSNRDLVVIGGGTTSGLEPGQQFFVRRRITFGGTSNARGVKTLGWVRVVAVNESTAIALVDHVCSGIVSSDYLEPFAAPVLPVGIDRDDTPGEADFSTLGHIITGSDDRLAVGARDFALIDWGAAQGLTAGARFAIYRDVGVHGMPLANVGEGVVVSTGSTTALARVTRARDAIYSGDYIALRK